MTLIFAAATVLPDGEAEILTELGLPQQAEVWRQSISRLTTARVNISRFGIAFA